MAIQLPAPNHSNRFLCVDNVDMNTGINELIIFVTSLGVRVYTCHQVKPRKSVWQVKNNVEPKRHCFRLSINRADSEMLLQDNVWPSDIIISKWYFGNKPDDANSRGMGADGNAVADASAAAGRSSPGLQGHIPVSGRRGVHRSQICSFLVHRINGQLQAVWKIRPIWTKQSW